MTKITKKSPAFQFYPDLWLTDPDILFMTPEQEGAYIRLLCYCWLDKDLSIPDNEEQLIVLSRLNKGGLQMVKPKFNQHPSKVGFLTHSRLQKEREKQEKWREKSSIGGRKSKKNSSQSPENKQKNKGGYQMVEPKGDSLSPFPSLNLKEKEKTKNKKAKEIETAPAEKKYWFLGDVIKLNRADYETWLDLYGGTEIQFDQWLSGRDDWLFQQAPERQKNWFLSTKKALESLKK